MTTVESYIAQLESDDLSLLRNILALLELLKKAEEDSARRS